MSIRYPWSAPNNILKKTFERLSRSLSLTQEQNRSSQRLVGTHNYPLHISFESLFETDPDKLNELLIIKSPRTVRLRDPPDDGTDEAISKRLTIAEPFAKFFACCEISIAHNMRDQINIPPNHSKNPSIIIRFTRTASFLRRTILGKEQFIAKGPLSRVCRIRTLYDANVYALKKVPIKIPEDTDELDIDNYIVQKMHDAQERDAMFLREHPFFCKLKGSWIRQALNKPKFFRVFMLEYAPFGSLEQFINKKFHVTMRRNFHDISDEQFLQQYKRHTANPSKLNVPVSVDKRRKLIYIYAAEMASALDHLHRYGIVHRDFKPSNILIGEDFHLRVANFGYTNSHKAHHSFHFNSIDLSVDSDPECLQEPIKDIMMEDFQTGTFAYCYTPEFLTMNVTNNNRFHPMDMWALGVTLFELYTGVQPFSGAIPKKCDDPRLLSKEIILWKKNRVLTNPLYSKFVEDETYRKVVSKLICKSENRLIISEVLNIIGEKMSRIVGKSIKELSNTKLEFMTKVFCSQN